MSFVPSVSQIGGVVQRAPAPHIPLVHIGPILQQELTSHQRALCRGQQRTNCSQITQRSSCLKLDSSVVQAAAKTYLG